MARLFTNATTTADDDLEIDLDHPDDIENNSTTGNKQMTISALKGKAVGITKKIAGGSWLKLLSLPPQELVAELKVTSVYAHITLTIILFASLCLDNPRLSFANRSGPRG